MRSLIVVLVLLVGFSGCVKKNKVPTVQADAIPGMHEVKVDSVTQTSQYTYLKVSENGASDWIAVTAMDAKVGETYYYTKALEMSNFKSKELNRVFATVYFVEDLSKQPVTAPAAGMSGMGGMSGNMAEHKGKAPDAQKEGISVSPAENGLSIAKLYTDRANYSGKTVKMKGQVVKVNDEVMGKNWIHIQDGSKDGDNFDLTITTMDKVKVDDVVTFEGTISLKKDFGYGYFYEVILEDAKLIK
jgi:hypothetical protein